MRARLHGPGPLLGASAAVAVAVLATLALDQGQLDQLTFWVAESVLALSLVLVWGRGGIFSLGQTALYGLAAYAYGVVAVNMTNSFFLPFALLAGVATAVIAAAFVGYFMFYGRVSPINVAIITLAVTLVLFALLNNTAEPRYHIGQAKLGGFNGMEGIPLARFGGPEAGPMSPRAVFLFVCIVAAALFAGVAYLLRTPFGRIVVGIRSNERRAELLGYDVRLHRWLLFVVGAAVAGLAGGLYVVWGSFITPTVFTLPPAVVVVIWVLAGGRDRLLGAPIGVFVVQGLTTLLSGAEGQYSPIYLGVALIAIVLLLPRGLFGLVELVPRRLARPVPVRPSRPISRAGELQLPPRRGPSELSAIDLRKRFAGITAVDGVTLTFPKRGTVCLIGPNGAGKSTLFALLTGTERPTAGKVLLDSVDITRLPAHRRARSGIGIKLQTASVFADLPVIENLWLAAYAGTRRQRDASVDAEHVLGFLGLADDAPLAAETLAHGHQQWLEIGMVLAMRPSVMLLDEPSAGMSIAETESTAELIRLLAQHAAVVVIEHDMAFIRQLDAPVTVLHLGKPLAQGRIKDLETDDRVLDVYLGRHHMGRQSAPA